MSAATALAFEKSPRRVSRHPVNIPLDLIALRSGVPENLPGRCTDLSEAGVGAVLAGELLAGQQVAIELRLPNVGVPVRVRALVRYQSRLRCGLEFVGLSMEQREMIRYWAYRSAADAYSKDFNRNTEYGAETPKAPVLMPKLARKSRRRIRVGRRAFYILLTCMLMLAGLGWWQWQKSWSELETGAPIGKSGLRVSPETGLRVSPETMDQRIVTKVDPVYPEAARAAGTQGVVVLDATIAPDGRVTRLRPVSGADLLVQSATEAVQSWKFEPYLYGGKAVEVETTIALDFRLN